MSDLASMAHYTPCERRMSTPRVHPVCVHPQNAGMHESMARLLVFARQKTASSPRMVEEAADLKEWLNLTPAVLSNWKARGISKEGALAAEAVFGCSANWVLTGKGEMVPKNVWPFTLLTPEQVQSLPAEHLATVEKVALDLLGITKVPHPPTTPQPNTVPPRPGELQILKLTTKRKNHSGSSDRTTGQPRKSSGG